MDYEMLLLDVFDTAIHRIAAEPTDVFTLVQARAGLDWSLLPYAAQIAEYPKERVLAEQTGKKKLNSKLTLDEIYSVLNERLKLPEKPLNKLKQTEIEIETELCYADPEILAVFNKAKKTGKKICFLSDTCPQSGIIRNMLEKCGYTGEYEVIAPCEAGVDKADEKVDGKADEKVDDWLLELTGIPRMAGELTASLTFGLLRKLTLRREEKREDKHEEKHEREHEEKPEKTREKRFAAGFEDYGRYIFGPFVFGFLMYTRKILNERKPDVTILFARDMYLFDKLLDLPHKYVYLNRKTLMLPAFQGVDERYDQLSSMSRLYYRDMHKKSLLTRPITEKYIASVIGDAKKIALVDVGWTGNIQRSFARLAQEYDGEKDIFGIYAKMSGALPFDPGQTYYSWLDGHPKENSLWHGGVELLELALTAPHGTTLELAENNGDIVPVIEKSNQEELYYLSKAAELQKGILDFVHLAQHSIDTNTFCADYLCGTGWAEPFFRFVTAPTYYERRLFGSLTHSRDAGKTTARQRIAEFWK